MNYEQVALVEDFLLRFWNALDQRNFEVMASYTSADCIWQRGTEILTGRQEIMTLLKRRPANRQSRHLITNLRTIGGGGKFTASYVFLAFVHDAQEGEEAPYPVALPQLIANMLTRGHYDDDGVIISHIEARPLFTQQSGVASGAQNRRRIS